MSTLSITIICLIVAAVPLVLYLLYRSPPVPPMRTASHRKIERETARVQRQVPEPHQRAGCDIQARMNVHSLCKERARRDARHQARMEDLYGILPVNRYPPHEPGYVDWAIELAEARTELFHMKQNQQQTTTS